MNVLSIPLNLSLFSFSGCVHVELLRKLFGSSPPPLIYFIYITENKQGLPLSIWSSQESFSVVFSFNKTRIFVLYFIRSSWWWALSKSPWYRMIDEIWKLMWFILCFCHDINIESLWFAIKPWCMLLTYVRFEWSWKSDSIWVMIFTFWSTLLLFLSVF